MSKCYLEFVGGNAASGVSSAKFYEVCVAGKSVTVRYGRIGSQGQSKTTMYGSAREAEIEAEKLVASKLRKGYKAPAKKAPAKKAPAKKAPAKKAPAKKAPAKKATVDFGSDMTKTFRITLPLVVERDFDPIEPIDDMDYVKEQLGELLDMLLMSTDYLHDYWKAAQVEEV